MKETRIGNFLTLPSHKYRHIHFLDFNRQGIISYAVKILYYALKEKAIHPIVKNDLAIGHILTLLQGILQFWAVFPFFLIHMSSVCASIFGCQEVC